MDYEFISTLEHEIEAGVLEAVLKDRQIPYRLRCFHDLAYDGLFQSSLGWGAVYAPQSRRDEILTILADIRP